MKQESHVQERMVITVVDGDGNIIDTRETYRATLTQRIKKWLGFGKCYADDLITDICLADIAEFLTTQYGYISIGTGTTAPARTDTQLEAEILSRIAATVSTSTTFYTGDTAVFRATFTPTYDVGITESGLHKMPTSSGDRMGAREKFTALPCPAGTGVTIEWQIVTMR